MEQNTSTIEPEPNTDVRVKVFRDDNGVLQVECSRPIPNLTAVAAHLSKTQQREVKKSIDWGRTVREAITKHVASVPFQDWANAIGEAIIQADANANGGSFEANTLREPAYLALGDTLFRLSPVELIKTNKALVATKKRANEKANVAIKKKLAEGQLAADTLVETAARIKQEAEETLRRTSRQQPAPAWAVDSRIPCKFDGYRWCVECVFYLKIEYFDVNFYDSIGTPRKFRWQAIPKNSVPIRLWVPINQDGSYALTSIYVDHLSSEIPHISFSAACLSLGDAPAAIKSIGNLHGLRDSIERCMRGVQLDSLRTPIRDWLPTFKDSVPPELYKAIKGGDWSPACTLAKATYEADQTPAQETENEGTTTWTA